MEKQNHHKKRNFPTIDDFLVAYFLLFTFEEKYN